MPNFKVFFLVATKNNYKKYFYHYLHLTFFSLFLSFLVFSATKFTAEFRRNGFLFVKHAMEIYEIKK